MKTRADIIDELEDKYEITADSLTNRELLIIGAATGDHDNEVEKLFIPVVSGSSSDEPENCPKEYNEDVCDGCEFREYEMVGHPGGCSYATVEKAKCGWGYWEDDF